MTWDFEDRLLVFFLAETHYIVQIVRNWCNELLKTKMEAEKWTAGSEDYIEPLFLGSCGLFFHWFFMKNMVDDLGWSSSHPLQVLPMIFEVKTLLGRKTHCVLVHFFGSLLVELILFNTRSMWTWYHWYPLKAWFDCIISSFVRVSCVSFGESWWSTQNYLGLWNGLTSEPPRAWER